MKKRLTLNTTFILVIKLKNESDNEKFLDFLNKMNITNYQYTWYSTDYVYNIQCDNFMDAAVIENFLNTEKINAA